MPGAELTEKAAVDALVKVVEDYVAERWRLDGYDLPEGLCLEMHPHVYYMILRNWTPGYSTFVSGRELPLPAEVPVKISPDLPDGTWRLAVITAEVINGGVMPGA